MKWVFERVHGTAKAVDTPIGRLPAPDSLDVSGLEVSETALQELLRVDLDRWTSELPALKSHYERFGAKLPQGLRDELSALEQRLAASIATA